MAWLDVLGDVHGLAGAKGDPCERSSGRCADRAGTYLGTHWPGCPVRSALSDPRLLAVVSLDSAAQVSGIADWPEGYAAWVPRLLAELRRKRDERQAHAKEQIRGR